MLGIVMQDGWNGLDLGEALEAEQKKISAELPTGLTFTKVTDQAVNIAKPSMSSCSSSSSPLAWSWWSVWSASAGASASWSRRPCR